MHRWIKNFTEAWVRVALGALAAIAVITAGVAIVVGLTWLTCANPLAGACGAFAVAVSIIAACVMEH
jgi:hypothetical protein